MPRPSLLGREEPDTSFVSARRWARHALQALQLTGTRLTAFSSLTLAPGGGASEEPSKGRVGDHSLTTNFGLIDLNFSFCHSGVAGTIWSRIVPDGELRTVPRTLKMQKLVTLIV